MSSSLSLSDNSKRKKEQAIKRTFELMATITELLEEWKDEFSKVRRLPKQSKKEVVAFIANLHSIQFPKWSEATRIQKQPSIPMVRSYSKVLEPPKKRSIGASKTVGRTRSRRRTISGTSTSPPRPTDYNELDDLLCSLYPGSPEIKKKKGKKNLNSYPFQDSINTTTTSPDDFDKELNYLDSPKSSSNINSSSKIKSKKGKSLADNFGFDLSGISCESNEKTKDESSLAESLGFSLNDSDLATISSNIEYDNNVSSKKNNDDDNMIIDTSDNVNTDSQFSFDLSGLGDDPMTGLDFSNNVESQVNDKSTEQKKSSLADDLLASLNYGCQNDSTQSEKNLDNSSNIEGSFSLEGLDDFGDSTTNETTTSNSLEFDLSGLPNFEKPNSSSTKPAEKSMTYDDFMAAFSNPKTEEITLPPRGTSLLRGIGIREDMNRKGMQKIKKKSVTTGLKKKGVYQMEDTHYIGHPFYDNENIGIFGIFDGHADKYAAEKAKTIFPELFQKEITSNPLNEDSKDLLIDLFLKTDKELIEFETEGTTATIVLIWKINGKRYLQSANVGDSTPFLIRNGNAIILGVDHKVNNPSEVERMIKAGMHINKGQTRINGLALCRTLGDHFIKENFPGVIALPYVSNVYELNDSDSLLILASDGLWDVMNGQEAYEMIKHLTNPQDMAGKLINYALTCGKCTDNITVIVVSL